MPPRAEQPVGSVGQRQCRQRLWKACGLTCYPRGQHQPTLQCRPLRAWQVLDKGQSREEVGARRTTAPPGLAPGGQHAFRRFSPVGRPRRPSGRSHPLRWQRSVPRQRRRTAHHLGHHCTGLGQPAARLLPPRLVPPLRVQAGPRHQGQLNLANAP
eukprot:scaffold14339_cov107-Isochrysis_galbana.AAC.5